MSVIHRFITRTHLFLGLAVLTAAVTITGYLWTAPFQPGASGLPRAFYGIWETLLLPLQFVGAILSALGVPPSRALGVVLLIAYCAGLVALDRKVSGARTT